MLTFEPEAHRYFWDGKPVTNVTRIIESLTDLSMIPADVLENARQEGLAIHKTVELHINGTIADYDIPEWLEPRVAAWEKFLRDTDFKPLHSERRVYHPLYRYAGTLDIQGAFPKHAAVLDIKRTILNLSSIGVQLAGYVLTLDGPPAGYLRYGLQLNADGNYKLVEFKDRDDFGDFLALLRLYRRQERHNQLEAA